MIFVPIQTITQLPRARRHATLLEPAAIYG
jgi:hypothetical protein